MSSDIQNSNLSWYLYLDRSLSDCLPDDRCFKIIRFIVFIFREFEICSYFLAPVLIQFLNHQFHTSSQDPRIRGHKVKKSSTVEKLRITAEGKQTCWMSLGKWCPLTLPEYILGRAPRPILNKGKQANLGKHI